MSCHAAIYRFSQHDDELLLPSHTPWPETLSFSLDLIDVVEVDTDGFTLPEIAAAAWVEALGRYRHEKLSYLNAPQEIIEAQLDIGRIVKEAIKEAPSAWREGNPVFLCDNQVETWLILLQMTSELSDEML